jgi:CheY-like chemotaxis protein
LTVFDGGRLENRYPSRRGAHPVVSARYEYTIYLTAFTVPGWDIWFAGIILAAVEVQMVVLVVDDEDDLREAIADLLRRRGYSVLVAANGQAALSLLRGEPLRPALILLDLAMPIMDGREFLAVIRADAALADIPVVVASAQPFGDTARGESGLLRKPFELDELFATVDSYCRPRVLPH